MWFCLSSQEGKSGQAGFGWGRVGGSVPGDAEAVGTARALSLTVLHWLPHPTSAPGLGNRRGRRLWGTKQETFSFVWKLRVGAMCCGRELQGGEATPWVPHLVYSGCSPHCPATLSEMGTSPPQGPLLNPQSPCLNPTPALVHCKAWFRNLEQRTCPALFSL